MDNTNETKTRREWLEMLPEPYRTQAIDACIAEKTIDSIVEFDYAVSAGFIWSDENRKEWRKINKRWLSGEFLPKTENRKYRYPWHEAPDWAVWAATDADGEAFWFGSFIQDDCIFMPKQDMIPGQFDATDWKKSLEIRPAEFQKQKTQ